LWQIAPSEKKANNNFSTYVQTGQLPSKILKQIGFFHCTINKKGEIIHSSYAFAKFMGYSKERLIKKDLGKLCLSGKEILKELVFNNHASLAPKAEKSCQLEIETFRNPKWVQCFV